MGNTVDLTNPEHIKTIETWAKDRAFMNLRLGFALVGEHQKINYANDLFVKMTGNKNLDEVLGSCLVEQVPELKGYEHWLTESSAQRQRRVIADLQVVRSEDGKNEFYSVIVESLAEIAGNALLVLFTEIQPDVMLDIHSRKALAEVYDQQEYLRNANEQMSEIVIQREASLKTSQAYNEAVLRSTSDGVLVINNLGVIQQANLSAEMMFDVDAGSLSGVELWSFLEPESNDPAVMAAVKVHEYSNLDATRDFQFVCSSGKSFYAEITINGMLLPNEELFVVVVRDVSDRVMREQTILQHQADLKALNARMIDSQEEERARIALDLHDDIGQRITALGMSLRQFFKEKNMSLDDLAPELNTQIEETATAIRSLSMDLRPSVLDHFGLVEALGVLGSRLEERSKFHVVFKFESLRSGDRFSSRIESAVYRIIQEALTNAVRYSEAGEVHVLVAFREDILVLSVRDEGVGFNFDPKQASKKSVGILGMKERAAQAGGELFVLSNPGQGTTIMAELPLSGNK